MDAKWDDYTHFPASGEEFERYVGTVFDDLGYKVYLTPRRNDYGVDLLLEEPKTEMRIAVQTKFYNKSSLGNTPIQEVLAGLPLYKAQVGWVVTNGRFTDNAKNLAKANGVRLIDNDGLNDLIDQAKTAKNKAEFEKNVSVETKADGPPKPKDDGSLKEGADVAVKEATSSEADAERGAAAQSPSAIAGSSSPASTVVASSTNVASKGSSSVGAAAPASSGPLVSEAPPSVSSASPANVAVHPAQPMPQPPIQSTPPTPQPVFPAVAMNAPIEPVEPIERFQHVVVYGLDDIQARWNCTIDDIMAQIDEGMPMVQLPNGIWGITQGDLLAWEAHMEQARQESLRHQRIFSVIFIGSAIIIFTICILLLVYSGVLG